MRTYIHSLYKSVLLLIFPAVLLLTGCERKEAVPAQDDPVKGTPVRFARISTGQPETRATYGSDWYNSVVEILWESGDRVRIASDAAQTAEGDHFAPYEVSQPYAATTDLLPVSGDGLLWGSGAHNFYAVYPEGEVTSGGVATYEVTGSIGVFIDYPTSLNSADGEDPYMFAAVSASTPGEDVSLTFQPMVTTFEIELNPECAFDIPGNAWNLVVWLESESKAMRGECTATITPSTTSALSTVSYQFPDVVFDDPSDPSLTPNNLTGGLGEAPGYGFEASSPIIVRILALPQAYNDLTLHIRYTTYDTDRYDSSTWGTYMEKEMSYDIPLTGLTFPAGEVSRLTGIPIEVNAIDNGPDNPEGQSYYYLGDPDPSEVHISMSSPSTVVTLDYSTVFCSDEDYMMYGAPMGPGADSYMWDGYASSLAFDIYYSEEDAIEAGNAWINDYYTNSPSGTGNANGDFYIDYMGGNQLTFWASNDNLATYYVLVYTYGVDGYSSSVQTSVLYVNNPYVIIPVYLNE